jgi:hypothetical protein
MLLTGNYLQNKLSQLRLININCPVKTLNADLPELNHHTNKKRMLVKLHAFLHFLSTGSD